MFVITFLWMIVFCFRFPIRTPIRTRAPVFRAAITIIFIITIVNITFLIKITFLFNMKNCWVVCKEFNEITGYWFSSI